MKLCTPLFIKTVFKKGKRKVQGVPQSQAAALPTHQEEGETDKTKQVQIVQTSEKSKRYIIHVFNENRGNIISVS